VARRMGTSALYYMPLPPAHLRCIVPADCNTALAHSCSRPTSNMRQHTCADTHANHARTWTASPHAAGLSARARTTASTCTQTDHSAASASAEHRLHPHQLPPDRTTLALSAAHAGPTRAALAGLF
jgi:hypothetical protein